jgi:hypothetical protein
MLDDFDLSGIKDERALTLVRRLLHEALSVDRLIQAITHLPAFPGEAYDRT